MNNPPSAALTEADTCRKFVLPKLYASGWDDDQISEQKTFTDGRIVVGAGQPRRRPQKRADYLLRYRHDFTIAVVEAKPSYKSPGDGIQQPGTVHSNPEFRSTCPRQRPRQGA